MAHSGFRKGGVCAMLGIHRIATTLLVLGYIYVDNKLLYISIFYDNKVMEFINYIDRAMMSSLEHK